MRSHRNDEMGRSPSGFAWDMSEGKFGPFAGQLFVGDQYDASEDLWVVDLISRYTIQKQTTVYLKVENVFDELAIVSRIPDGARPNKPRTASIGVQWSF